MNFFNQLYLTVFSRFKGRFKQKANTIALYYVSVVEIACQQYMNVSGNVVLQRVLAGYRLLQCNLCQKQRTLRGSQMLVSSSLTTPKSHLETASPALDN